MATHAGSSRRSSSTSGAAATTGRVGATPSGQPPAASPVSYTANAVGDPGRLIVLAVARESISFGEGRPAMWAAAEFLDTLNPNDQVALVTVPPPGPRVDFTTDRQRVREKLEMAVGVGQDAVRFYHGLGIWEARQIVMAVERGDLFSNPSMRRILDRICRGDNGCWSRVIDEAARVVEAEDRQRLESIWSLERILEGLRDIEGRKFVVWIAEELATEDGGGIEFFGIRSLAAAARASVHVILLRKPDIDASATDRSGSELWDRMEEELGLGLIADYTGGAVHRVINNPEHAFAQLGRELSGYYLLGVEPLEGEPGRGGARDRRVGVAARRTPPGEARGGPLVRPERPWSTSRRTSRAPADVARRRDRPAAPRRHVRVPGGRAGARDGRQRRRARSGRS